MTWRWGSFLVFCGYMLFVGWLAGFLMPRWFAVVMAGAIGLIAGLQRWFETPVFDPGIFERERETMEEIGKQLASVWVFGISGILLMFVGYFLFDKLTPRIDFAKELVENKNIAVAIMVASIIFGVAVIVAAIMLPWPSPMSPPVK